MEDFLKDLKTKKEYKDLTLTGKITHLKRIAFGFQKDHSEVAEQYKTMASLTQAKVIAEIAGGDIKKFGPNATAQENRIALEMDEAPYDTWKPILRKKNALYWSLKEVEREIECLELLLDEVRFDAKLSFSEKSLDLQKQELELEFKQLGIQR